MARRRLLLSLALAGASRLAGAAPARKPSAPMNSNADLQDIRDIAEQAYVYAYSPVMAYGLTYVQIVTAPPAERQPVNTWKHFRTLASPDFNNYIPWVNTDTVYSSSWLDLRAEPVVLSTPAFPAHRFQNIQINDVYGHNIINRGTRTHGNVARRYLIAGPDWRGDVPDGIDEVIRGESWLLKMFARILVEGASEDWDALHRLQDGFGLQTLSAWSGHAAPPPAAPIAWVVPDGNPRLFEARSPSFIRYLNFVLGMCRVHESELALMQRFARIGIGAGRDFDPDSLSPERRAAIQAGIDAGYERIQKRLAHLDDPVNGWVYPLNLRGPRSVLAGSDDAFLRRAVLARHAIWGPESAEVVYMTGESDLDGEALDGSQHHYVFHLDRKPPVRGFWSFTVYDAKTRLLVKHPSGRYKIGDRDGDLQYGSDGSLTLYVQHDTPGTAHEANWLPAPQGPFQLVARLYWPEPELLDGRYQPPGLRKAI
ncbi:MAG: DUF1254 domain-containing protein [Solimonas sp.]